MNAVVSESKGKRLREKERKTTYSTMDDSDIALEKAVMNLDLGDDQESSDSEVEQQEEMIEPQHPMNGGGGGRVSADRTQSCAGEERPQAVMLTRERLERRYPPAEESMYDVPAGETHSQISESCISTSSAVSSMVPITLDAVVNDDRLFLMFRRFLKDQCITRNLNFWLTCEHYRQLSTDNREYLLEVAKAIYIKFIKNSAPQKVTIHAETKNRIKKSLDYKSEPLTVQLFDTAQQEIWEEMERNEVLQFALSESFAECSQFTGLTIPTNSSYMAAPAYGVRGAGSLQHSGSEDSASISSFSTDSDAGPRSAVMGQLSRPRSTAARKAMSDTEGSRRRNQSQSQQGHKLYAAKDNPVSSENFVALVTERLLAVQKDRKAMEHKVRDDGRRVGKSYEEIMSLEWYDHPESCKYLLPDMSATTSSVLNPASSSASLAPPHNADHLHQHSVKHILSPHSPGATPRSSQDLGKKTLAHINSLAQQEVEHALKDLEVTNQVNKKRRIYGGLMSTSSSVYSTYSDSGVGGDWATSGLVTPIHDYTQAYVRGQTMLNEQLPTRQKEAQAAAVTLISNSPQPELLNPHVPRPMHHHGGERSRRNHHFVRNFPGAYSSDDSSSCYTMTSQSSTSEALFIPRKTTPSVYTESDEPHHFTHHQRYRERGTRQLSQPKRSYKLQQQQQQQHHPQSNPSPMSQSHRQQQLNQSSGGGGGSGGSGSRGSGGDTLIVYHLDEIPTPYAKRVPGGGDITLQDFKEKVFMRKGDYRFFFKMYCEDLEMAIMEEISDDSAVLPLVQGKIFGRVEKTST